MSSELELLRQRITELEKRNVDLERENKKLGKELGSRIEDCETRLAKVRRDSLVEQHRTNDLRARLLMCLIL